MAESLREQYLWRSFLERARWNENKVLANQRKFGAPDGRLVFLKTRGDMRVYNGLLLLTGLGTAYVVGCLALFATGKLKKKERS